MLRPYEIQNLYLEVQQKLGEFSAICTNDSQRTAISNLSVCLLRIKRDLIGTVNEIDTDNIVYTTTATSTSTSSQPKRKDISDERSTKVKLAK